MKKFWVSGYGTVYFTASIEAETLEEAKEKVINTPLVELGWDSEETEITDGAEIVEQE